MYKHRYFYLISIIIIFLLVIVLFYLYDQYLNIRNINNQVFEERMQKVKNSNIKQLHYLKFSHPHHISDDDGMSLFLIETIQIDNCKYIILSKKDQSPTIIHANDCEFCLKNNK